MTKTALITGATGGLGTEFVKLFASNGDNLVLVGRNLNKLTALKESIAYKYSVKVDTIAVDFSEETAAEQIFDHISKTNVQINYLIRQIL